jgi:replicative DNA helicase
MNLENFELSYPLPAAIEAEQTILGICLIEKGAAFPVVSASLLIDDFSITKHQKIFERMCDLDARGSVIDSITLAEELMKRGELESVDGLGYLVDLDRNTPHVSDPESYINIIRRKSELRRLALAAHKLYMDAVIAEEDAETIIARADSVIGQIVKGRDGAGWRSVGETLGEYEGNLRSLISPSRNGDGIGFPWKSLQGYVPVLQGGDLIVLAGRPSHGKTCAALQMAIHAATGGARVGIISLETRRKALICRMISNVSRVDFQRMRLGYMNSDERASVVDAKDAIAALPIEIDDTAGLTASAIRSKLKGLRSKRGLDLAVVDHFHLVAAADPREQERSRYNRIADEFQRCAREMDIPLLILAQASRKCEEENRAPGMSDLKETGKLEENADVAMFTYRPEMYAKNRHREELRGQAEIIVAKQRDGPSGTVHMTFIGNQQRFEERA